jgi:predicted N-acetyltransferase YhbS
LQPEARRDLVSAEECRMNITIREAKPEDGAAAGRICYEGFKAIGEQHNFPPDFPNVETATNAVTSMIAHPRIYGIVAEADGKIAGSNFLDERDPIAGLGPISVDPAVQNSGIGRELMLHFIRRAEERHYPGVRLVQSGYHNRSLCLYTKLGFDTREPLSIMQGKPLKLEIPGYQVRAATERDLDACNRLCVRIHGHTRGGELGDAIGRGIATVVERGGRITGYATLLAFFGHAVGETNEDLEALIGAAPGFFGPGFLVPTRNCELFRWCLGHGLRLVYQMTLMSMGLYNAPAGAWLPSVLY